MREAWGPVVLAAIVAVSGLAGSAMGQAVSIDVAADGNQTTTDRAGVVTNETSTPGERYAWSLNLTENTTRVDVTIDRDFDIDRARQLVPLVDEKHFVETDASDLNDTGGAAYNLSASADAWTYEFAVPGPGEHDLTLHRDVTPPEIEIVNVGNITHFGADVSTDTSEPALTTLVIDAPGEQARDFSTPRPSTWQLFPIQGLEADQKYSFHVNATDWSGNQATSPTRTVTTAPEPSPPKPEVTPVSPQPNATVAPGEVTVSADFSSEESPVVTEEIQLFFDKEPVDSTQLAISEGTITYEPPGPLQERVYFANVEVPNYAGGVGKAQWSFTVADPQASPGPGALLLAGLLGGAALFGGRRGCGRGER